MSSRGEGPNDGAVRVRRLALAGGPDDVGAGDHEGPGSAVVADREVLPVRWERGVVGAEHRTDVHRVVLAGVEVDVVGDLERAGAAVTASMRCEVALDRPAGARVA